MSASIRSNGENSMKPIGVVNAAALLLLLGIAAPAYGGQEKQEEKSRPAQQQEAKPEKRQEAQAPKQQPPHQQQQAQAPKQQPPHQQQQAQAPKQQPPHQQQQAQAPKQQPQHQQQAQASKQQPPHQQRADKGQQQQGQRQGQQQSQRQGQEQNQRQASSSQRPQRTQEAQNRQRSEPALRLSARGRDRIPDERFHSNFGREHEFSIGSPVLVGGYSRFQYGGYWFGFVDPWPADWYYTDDVYIDYVDGGYYMFNPYYPGARFAISVVI
jgi:hypothetical protein